MIDLRLPKPLHRPLDVSIPDGPILLDLRFFALSGGPLVKRFADAADDRRVVWWFDEMLEADIQIVASRVRKGEIPSGPLHVTPNAHVELVAEFAGAGFTIRAATPEWCETNPGGVDWLREAFPLGLAGLDEFSLRMVHVDYEKELEHAIRGIDDVRFFPKFSTRSLNAERVSKMSEELSSLLALHSPQATERNSGLVAIANPSLQILRGVDLRCWFRVGDVVVEHVLVEKEAAVLDELNESLGGIAIADLTKRFGQVVETMLERGLLLGR